jgi:hypothetical protein
MQVVWRGWWGFLSDFVNGWESDVWIVGLRDAWEGPLTNFPEVGNALGDMLVEDGTNCVGGGVEVGWMLIGNDHEPLRSCVKAVRGKELHCEFICNNLIY